MIQPYVSSIDDDGERALVFIDGSVLARDDERRDAEHRRRRPRRVISPRTDVAGPRPNPTPWRSREAVLSEEIFRGILYARVDLVRMPEGWAIMELELVEPSLFLAYDESAPRRLAEAIRSRLD